MLISAAVFGPDVAADHRRVRPVPYRAPGTRVRRVPAPGIRGGAR